MDFVVPIAVEDWGLNSGFHGIDPEGIVRAAADDLQQAMRRSASTIAEQYVKNAYVGGYDESLTLKVHEAILAWELSDRW